MKFGKEVALGLFILVAGVLLAYMSITVGKIQFGDTTKVQALFKSASGIVKDAPVMMAGIEIGHVEQLEVKNGQALLTLLLHDGTEAHKDAHAEIRSKSLLGEKYILLTAGSPSQPLLQDGDAILETKTPVDLDEVLNHLAPVLTKLDPNDLNSLIHTLAVSLDGKSQDIRTLLTGSAELMGELTKNKGTITRLVNNLDAAASGANSVLNGNRGAINRIVRNLDSVTARLRTDAPDLVQNINKVTVDVQKITGPFSGRAPMLAQNLDRIADGAADLSDQLKKHPELVPNLNQTLAELPPLLKKAPPMLDRLPVVLDQLSPVLKGADKLFGKAEDSLAKLNPVLDKANVILDEKKLKQILQEDGLNIHVDSVKLW